MRVVTVVAWIVLCSGAALAQSTAPAATPPAAPSSSAAEGITRDAYIQAAQERAAKAAGKRFDAMDADHDGILTKDEIAAYRAAHARKKASEQ